MKVDLKERIKTILQRILFPAIYRRAAKKELEPGLVLFSDCHHEHCPYSMRALYERMKDDPRFAVETDFHDYGKGAWYGLKCGIRFMKRYGRAQAVIICDNHLPVASAKKRKETFVVQLWHSGGALKKFGYDSAINVPVSYAGGNVFSNYDLVTVSAPYAIPAFVSAMKIDETQVKAIGTARSDCLFDEAYRQQIKEKFYREHPDYREKKIVLYAPTFRGFAGEPVTVGFEDVCAAGEALPKDYVLIKKPHPHDKNFHKVHDSKLSAEELLIVCDLLVTDYSSIIYDYALLLKPLLLYIPDFQEYAAQCGFYEDYDEIPAIRVFTKERLKDSIIEAVTGYGGEEREAMRSFAARTMSACDGGAVERILAEIAQAMR